MRRVMWIEDKSSGLAGPVRIGWVDVRNGGRRLLHDGRVFVTLRGDVWKANFYEKATGDHFWIEACRRDGRDALYNTSVEVDEDALEEYWVKIRRRPEQKGTRAFRAQGES